ncbi:dethiobiotin synthase [Pseudidiomarina insulisalsae]|uniref:ATP-dependent dethiobiotin synthetase BioD n=1 Tax=Pseudidiomarina insulisalsae TaxID=575789 RepID=A0A432YH99_9GAMM|nr:dethiobiotin synthase [Pseudidiomarina insulisalsae]RUO60339.1 dethiobiotin synthase [Pseudidiomarina insulisalsae]
MTCVFVAGTDTDVGKTVVTAALLTRLNQGGYRTLAMKPVAAGAEQTPDGLRNSDALALQQAMSVEVPYESVNPVCLAPPVAPHLAAAQIGQRLSARELYHAQQQLLDYPHDVLMIEGAGGWQVPLNDSESLADFARLCTNKVVLVVAMKLGCLNHALLSVADIQREGVEVIGWVANQPQSEPMRLHEENLAWLTAQLQQRFNVPCLGSLPFLPAATAQQLADHLLPSQELMSVLQGKVALLP